jgi:hypothetical protein
MAVTPITLTHPTAGVGSAPLPLSLPAQLDWPDEFAWDQVEQVTTYTTTGALIVESAAKQTGRPITLQGSETRAWCERGPLLTLRQWASQPGQTFTLLLRGTTRTVVFDHAATALEASPIVDYADPENTDYYAVTLRFLEL